MTRREFLEMVINGKVDEKVVEFAKNEIEKMNNKNEKRKTTLSKTQKENMELKVKMLQELPKEEILVASQVAEEMNISTQKASALLKQLVEENHATVTDTKYNKRKVKGYVLIGE